MTINIDRCPPAPPPGYRAAIDTVSLVVPARKPWLRIFWDGTDPFAFTQRGHRFDPLPAPWTDTAVLYAGDCLEAAIAEVLLRWHGQIVPGDPVLLSASAHLNGRRVARFFPTRPLELIDATGLGLAKIEAAVTGVLQLPVHAARSGRVKPTADDIFNCDASEYATTQQWCGWLRSQCPIADGINWMSRQFNTGRCIALFRDRCGTDLELISKPTQLYRKGSKHRALVDDMVHRLGWAIDK